MLRLKYLKCSENHFLSQHVKFYLETEIIETQNGTADFCLLPDLAESY